MIFSYKKYIYTLSFIFSFVFMPKAVKKKAPAKKKVVAKKTKKIIMKKPVQKKKNSRLTVLGIANVVVFLWVLVVNYLATSLPIGGMTTWALSDLYPNLFTPAWLTFSIRGLIYLALLGFVVRQLIDLFKKRSLGITKNVGIRFLLSCATNIGWIFARHNQKVFLSLLVMLAFLVILIVLAHKVQLGKKLGSRGDKLLVQVPFSLYLGWISVATIANTAARLVHIQRGMRGITPILWTMLVIIVATLLALLALRKKYNIIFALVVVRAFIGIIIKTLGAEVVYGQIVWLLGACIAVITAAIGRRFEARKKN